MTLENAKGIALHHELIKKQNEGTSAQLYFVKFKKKERLNIRPTSANGHNRNRTIKSRSDESQHNQKTQSSKGCGKCERSHAWGSFPAFGKKCYKCQKNNHFGKMCRNKQIQEVEGIASSKNYFIGSVGAEIPPWTTGIEILGTIVQFKIDTGADVNIINQETWIYLGKPTLKDTDSQLLSPTGRISTLGKFCINSDTHKMVIFVINSN